MPAMEAIEPIRRGYQPREVFARLCRARILD